MKEGRKKTGREKESQERGRSWEKEMKRRREGWMDGEKGEKQN